MLLTVRTSCQWRLRQLRPGVEVNLSASQLRQAQDRLHPLLHQAVAHHRHLKAVQAALHQVAHLAHRAHRSLPSHP